MMDMRRRYLYAGIGVLVLAVAVAIPAFSQQSRWGGPGSWGMMAPGWGGQGATPLTPVTSIDAAAARVRDVLGQSGYSDLAIDEVMEFSNHFYVLVKEKSTGTGAIELIVERNGFVHPEPGPNMMWNTKYGHMAGFGGSSTGYGPGTMGGMMGRWGYGGPRGPDTQPVNPSAQPITKDRAKQLAAQYLSRAVSSTSPDEGTAFYGYFTFDVLRNDKPAGMLSVNAYTGQVWYHTWHGTFVQEKEF